MGIKRCVTSTKKVVVEAAREVTPELMAFAIQTIRAFEDWELTSAEKRALTLLAIERVGGRLLGRAVGENLARLILEFALRAIRTDKVKEDELAEYAAAELEEAAA